MVTLRSGTAHVLGHHEHHRGWGGTRRQGCETSTSAREKGASGSRGSRSTLEATLQHYACIRDTAREAQVEQRDIGRTPGAPPSSGEHSGTGVQGTSKHREHPWTTIPGDPEQDPERGSLAAARSVRSQAGMPPPPCRLLNGREIGLSECGRQYCWTSVPAHSLPKAA